MKKFAYIITLSFICAGCSQAFNDSVKKEWHDAKSYNYAETFRTGADMKEVWPNSEEKQRETEAELCMHEDAHEREITANGINDSINYRYCTLSPSTGVQYPQRFDGR